MKEFYIYVLKCNDGSYYTGHTALRYVLSGLLRTIGVDVD